MGMCAMYSFCKYSPRTLLPGHELVSDDDDSPRSGRSSSSDGGLMLGNIKQKRNKIVDQQPAVLWKRSIPKGRRCEPLDFSGLILYDEHGNRLNRLTSGEDRPSLGV